MAHYKGVHTFYNQALLNEESFLKQFGSSQGNARLVEVSYNEQEDGNGSHFNTGSMQHIVHEKSKTSLSGENINASNHNSNTQTENNSFNHSQTRRGAIDIRSSHSVSSKAFL